MNSSTSSSKALIGRFFLAAAMMLITVGGASEWLVRTKVAPEDTFFKHIVFFNAASSPYAAFGDSHVARGFSPSAPILNLGYASENIEKMAWKAERYLERTPNPKIVLVQADPHLFSTYRISDDLDGYPEMFAQDKKTILLSLSQYYRPQISALWAAFVRNRGRFKSRIEFTEQGALLSPGDLSRWNNAGLDAYIERRAVQHEISPGFEKSVSARWYQKLVSDFVAAGAEVCLVTFPIAPVYRERVVNRSAETRVQYDKAMTFFSSFAEKPNVKLIDHRELYSDPELFRDPDHLNKTGAKKYGPLLQDICFAGVGSGDNTPSAITSTK